MQVLFQRNDLNEDPFLALKSISVLNLFFFILCSMFRAKKELDANLAVAHTWSEFNAMLDKQKVGTR